MSQIIFDFDKDADINEWRIVDDVVMGGKSSGSMAINSEGHGLFKGDVSLENNGGFSSVRYRLSPMNVEKFSKVVIKLKGDGKDYQFRIKSNSNDYYSYVGDFSSSGEWEEVKIDFGQMYPTFRGRKLNQANYPGDELGEVAFLIANKKEEHFELLIDKIELQ